MVPTQLCVGPQHRPQPQSDSPRAALQRFAQVPSTQIWPHAQPGLHSAGEQMNCVMSSGLRLQVFMPVQVPAQCPPQPSSWLHIAPGGHEGTQRQVLVVLSQAVPAAQSVPTPHEGPAPQGFAIVVPHATVEGAGADEHVRAQVQAPPTQVCAEAHARPHAPQLARSVAVFTQEAPHSVCAAAHAQRPAEQVVPLGQATPQAPQFALSEEVLTHRPPQYDCPVGHPHAPPAQPCPAGHTRPQMPQLVGSVLTTVQRPPHTIWPDGQAHRPPTQLCPVAQTVPHDPQLPVSLTTLTQRPPQ